jgi:hypothetical protein
MVHCVQQHPEVVVRDGRRFVARTYAAPRPDGRWDGWFVFLPLESGRELATEWETTQRTLADMAYWSEAITAVYLERALQRSFLCCPEVVLGRRAQRAEQQEALARVAAACEHAAAAARLAAKRATHDRRDAEAQLLAERAAAARAAALLQAKAAAAARAEAATAERGRRESRRKSNTSTRVAYSPHSSH